jgi:polyhydroxyalkanoate synthesis regulator phasin
LSRDTDVGQLKDEIRELKKTVVMLKETVNQLSTRIGEPISQTVLPAKGAQYDVFANQASVIDYDASWQRLVGLLQHASVGLTATELATRWGKSRSRTSEVLNKLVERGHLVKYRDGRRIKFRTLEE